MAAGETSSVAVATVHPISAGPSVAVETLVDVVAVEPSVSVVLVVRVDVYVVAVVGVPAGTPRAEEPQQEGAWMLCRWNRPWSGWLWKRRSSGRHSWLLFAVQQRMR